MKFTVFTSSAEVQSVFTSCCLFIFLSRQIFIKSSLSSFPHLPSKPKSSVTIFVYPKYLRCLLFFLSPSLYTSSSLNIPLISVSPSLSSLKLVPINIFFPLFPQHSSLPALLLPSISSLSKHFKSFVTFFPSRKNTTSEYFLLRLSIVTSCLRVFFLFFIIMLFVNLLSGPSIVQQFQQLPSTCNSVSPLQ